MLHARRQRLETLARAEAEGQSFWTDRFSPQVRQKILLALGELHERRLAFYANMAERAGYLIRRDEGIQLTNADQFIKECDDQQVPTAVEAIWTALQEAGTPPNLPDGPDPALTFETLVNEILNEHRISYELVNGRMVELTSKELHHEVVVPTLRLLAGLPGWSAVESAYQDALSEIAQNHPHDAVTDAARALQEALTLLGCQGSSLGKLLASARRTGLLAGHDEKLVKGIESMIDWVSVDRSQKGDAHKATSAEREDAWLTVHVVGALIIRLSRATNREVIGS